MAGRNMSVGELSHAIDHDPMSGMMWNTERKVGTTNQGPTILNHRYRTIISDNFAKAALDTAQWNLLDTSAAGTPVASTVSQTGGGLSLLLAATNELEVLGINFGNNLILNPAFGLVAEFSWTWAVAPAANQQAIIGFSSEHNDTLDSMDRRCWFSNDAAASIFAESDDETTAVSVDTTDDLTALTYVHGRIEFLTVNNVRMSLSNANGKVRQVNATTTFKVGAHNLQFVALMRKASGTTTPELRLGYVMIAQKDS